MNQIWAHIGQKDGSNRNPLSLKIISECKMLSDNDPDLNRSAFRLENILKQNLHEQVRLNLVEHSEKERALQNNCLF